MHLFWKILLFVISFVIIAAAIGVPLAFHFREKAKETVVPIQTTQTNNPTTATIQENNLTMTTTQANNSMISTTVNVLSTNTIINSTNNTSTTTTTTTVRLTNPITITTSSSTTTVRLTNSTTITTTTVSMTTTGVSSSSSSIQSQYSSSLTTNSSLYCRSGFCSPSNYYYESILMNVSTSGNYTIMSSSDIDTYGYIYNNVFYPDLTKQNLLTSDDESGGNSQFRINVYLQSMIKYILVVTTYSSNIIGPFTIIVNGPALITFSRASLTPLNQSNYSSLLTTTSLKYCQSNTCPGSTYYYYPILINIPTDGYYMIRTNTTFPASRFLYISFFDPSLPNAYLNNSYSNSVSNSTYYQLESSLYLYSMSNYILILSTLTQNLTGSFTISVTGLASVNLNQYNGSSLVQLNFSSPLTSSSPSFCYKNSCPGSIFYYRSFNISVSVNGYYEIRSYTDTSLDTIAFLYQNSFNPLSPSGYIASSDDEGGNNQFRFVIYLESTRKYVLVGTTYFSNRTGQFTLTAFDIQPNRITIG